MVSSRKLLALISLCIPILLGTLLPVLSTPSAQAAVPSERAWVADTYAAMHGSRAYVEERAARGTPAGHRLAVNLDIDNTSLASHYDYGKAVAVTLRFAKYARTQRVVLLFNTGRVKGDGRLRRAEAQLRAAGYVLRELCGRSSGSEGLSHSKQRCRQHFQDEGYIIVANVGNRRTDFTGGDYERAFRLPNYDNQLA